MINTVGCHVSDQWWQFWWKSFWFNQMNVSENTSWAISHTHTHTYYLCALHNSPSKWNIQRLQIKEWYNVDLYEKFLRTNAFVKNLNCSMRRRFRNYLAKPMERMPFKVTLISRAWCFQTIWIDNYLRHVFLATLAISHSREMFKRFSEFHRPTKCNLV